MTGSRLEELLWAEVDGELSTGERLELDRLLSSEPGANALQRQIAAVESHLGKIPSAEPPAELSAMIGAALDREPSPGGEITKSRAPGLLAWIASAARPARFAYAAAALSVVAVGALWLYRSAPPNSEHDLVGTILPDRPTPSHPVRVLETSRGVRVLIERTGERRVVLSLAGAVEPSMALTVGFVGPGADDAADALRMQASGTPPVRVEVDLGQGGGQALRIVLRSGADVLLDELVPIAEIR